MMIRPGIRFGLGSTLVVCLATVAQILSAADFSEARNQFNTGNYQQAETIAAAEVERGIWNRRWPELLIRCQMVTGQYSEALQTYQAAIKRYPTSLPLRVLGIQVANYNRLPDQAAAERAVIERYLDSGQLVYATPDTRVATGRFFARAGMDARIVLKSFFDRAREDEPEHLDAFVATGELAIEKGDFKVAADTVRQAQAKGLVDARLKWLLSRAFANSDPTGAMGALEESLLINPNFIPSLQRKAEQAIDRELYEEAEQSIEAMLDINPHCEQAFALRAVLAHLRGDFSDEKQFRKKALKFYPTNPEVDHLIGRKLSDKYRFAEGAAYQRRALIFDPKHSAASFQLAQDLLRLGDVEIGWQLAESAATQDPYNVVAFNLATLKDRLQSFETVRLGENPDAGAGEISAGIIVRMDPAERKVYGTAVDQLLLEARETFCKKYDIVLDRPVTVEIFPRQSDFAIRTFGLPGGEGFLGVCFGQVITANSPASQGPRPSNWKSVLWHEFCHVVTLTKTNNRMPRWLSEGISVYEERLKDPRWGQSMDATFRELILNDRLTPITQLSGAFMNPDPRGGLQFAYFQSSLVVEFMIDQHGLPALNRVLDDLAGGLSINDAIASQMGSLNKLQMQFEAFAKERALQFGGDLLFDRPGFSDDTPNQQRLDWASNNLDNYWARLTLGKAAMQARDWDAAIKHFEFLRSKKATAGQPNGVLESLATLYRETKQPKQEIKVLEELFFISADPLPQLQRFIEMVTTNESVKQSDWKRVLKATDHAFAIQPLSATLHQTIVKAHRSLSNPQRGIASLNALLVLEPIDIAGLHFQLAEAHDAAGNQKLSTQFVVDALLEAPRYRDAHRLLIELNSKPADDETADDETSNASSEAGK